MLTDNARYHHFKGIEAYLETLGNINILYLPKYCSDLNPIELLWRFLKANVTHNTFFAIFDELVQNVVAFLDSLKLDHHKIRKLCPVIG